AGSGPIVRLRAESGSRLARVSPRAADRRKIGFGAKRRESQRCAGVDHVGASATLHAPAAARGEPFGSRARDLCRKAEAGRSTDDHGSKRQPVTPADEYRHRLELREAAAAEHEKRQERVGLMRLAAFAAAAAAAWLSLQAAAISPWWLLAPSALFVALVVYHARVRAGLARARRAVAFYRRGVARIEDRWAGEGTFGTRFEDPHHVYAADLDLFGKG